MGEHVSVVGDFNAWNGRIHPMRVRGRSGVWELFIPGIEVGALYKFEIRDHAGGIRVKIDPYACSFQLRPDTAAYVPDEDTFRWRDQARTTNNARPCPSTRFTWALGDGIPMGAS